MTNVPFKEAAGVESVRQELIDIKQAVSKMADALTRLALLEERYLTFHALLIKIAERQDMAEQKRHEQEVSAARISDIPARVAAVEAEFRVLHIERQEDKAKFKTLMWTVRAFWAIAGSGIGLYALQLVAKLI
jgi:hypothetical protein